MNDVDGTISLILEHSSMSATSLDTTDAEQYLEHHGIQGQKWGKRQYQNPDGSLTPLGRVRYGVGAARKTAGKAVKTVGKAVKNTINPSTEELERRYEKSKQKKYRKELKEAIKENKRIAKGKEKDISEMSVEEIDAEILKISKQRQLSELRQNNSEQKQTVEKGRKELSPTGQFARDLAKELVSTGSKRALNAWVDSKFKEPESPTEKRSKELNRRSQDSQNALNATRNTIERRALGGDPDAISILSSVSQAKNGKQVKNAQAFVSNQSNQAYVPKHMKKV